VSWQTESVPRRRGGGCLRTFFIALIALIVLLVAGDFAAKAFAEREIASQIQKHGFPKKPSVTIEGFPFLTQVASRDIKQVRISSQDVREGPVDISKISAVMSDIRLSSGFSSGTVGRLHGSVLVNFGSLKKTLENKVGEAGKLIGASGLTLSAAGPDEVKASVKLLVVTGSATWRVSRLSGQEMQVNLVSDSAVPASFLSAISHFTITIPHLPLGVKIDDVRVTPGGVVGQLTGSNLPFGS
jgi:hypothetical protein